MPVPRRCALVLAAAAALAAPSAALARYEGNVNVFLGEKWLKESEWAPVDHQPEVGILLAFAPERSPIHFALDVLASGKDGSVVSSLYGPVSVHASTQEYAIGVRKLWVKGAARPFLGGGGCRVDSSIDLDAPGYRESLSAGDYGVWIETGAFWRIGAHFNLGFDLRYTWAEARYSNAVAQGDVAVGGLHLGALVGYGW